MQPWGDFPAGIRRHVSPRTGSRTYRPNRGPRRTAPTGGRDAPPQPGAETHRPNRGPRRTAPTGGPRRTERPRCGVVKACFVCGLFLLWLVHVGALSLLCAFSNRRPQPQRCGSPCAISSLCQADLWLGCRDSNGGWGNRCDRGSQPQNRDSNGGWGNRCDRGSQAQKAGHDVRPTVSRSSRSSRSIDDASRHCGVAHRADRGSARIWCGRFAAF